MRQKQHKIAVVFTEKSIQQLACYVNKNSTAYANGLSHWIPAGP